MGNINRYTGSRIRTIRIQNGWEQSAVAQKVGISNSSFSKIEYGYTDINLFRLTQIAFALQVELKELLPDTLKDETIKMEQQIKTNDVYIKKLKQIARNLELRLERDPGSDEI